MTIYNPTLRLESFNGLIIDGTDYTIEERCDSDEFVLSWNNGANSEKMHIDKISKMIHKADKVKLVAR